MWPLEGSAVAPHAGRREPRSEAPETAHFSSETSVLELSSGAVSQALVAVRFTVTTLQADLDGRIWQPGDDSPSAPPQMNSTCGSTGELAVAIAVRRPAMALSDGSSSKLRQYVSKLPHDSYSICNYHSSDKPDKLFEVQEQHGGKCRVWLNPLLGFPEAIKEAPRAEFEELSADVDDAKERIAEKVLKKLKQTVDPPDVIRKGSKDNQKLNLAGKGGYWVSPTLLKDPGSCQSLRRGGGR